MRRFHGALSAVFLAATTAAAFQSAPVRPLTFGEIAPIVFGHCAGCHRPGGSAPFSLLRFQDVQKRAAQIASVTKRRYMPPWLPAPGYGDFADDQHLTDAEISAIQAWIAQGAKEGDTAAVPPAPPPPATGGWELGKPDLVLELPRAYTLPANGDQGRDVFRNFVIPVPVDRTRYVRAIELRPNNPKIFHHANVLVDRSGTARGWETAPGLGFEGMDLEIESKSFDPDGYFLSWKPGSAPVSPSDGMSWRVDPGTDLILNSHMRPDGKPETVQVSLGLYFAAAPPTRFPMLLQLENDRAIDIPADDRNFVVEDEFQLPLDVDVLAVYPHAHYLGKDLQGYAILPDGKKEWLVWIKDWNLDWQGVFRYTKPVFLPKGSKVHMRWTYDNSAANVRNPHSPPRRVTAGNQATDEMSHLWLQVLPVGDSSVQQDPRLILQEAFMRHRVAIDPGDHIARYNLGSALQILGKLDESAAEYGRVLRQRPNDPVAHNSLGTVFQLQGKLELAIAEYQRVLHIAPTYSDAEYNLGRTFLSQGKLESAAACFRSVVSAQPRNTDARHSLGLALQLQGKLDEAMREYREILRLEPENTDAEYNLGRALMAQDQPAAAVASYERVLEAHPRDADAHHSLGLALAQLGDLTRAETELDQAARLKASDAEIHNDLGALLARQGKLQQASLEFHKALDLDPRDATTHYYLGRIYADQSDLSAAISEMETSIRLRPKDADVRNDLGNLLAKQGDIANAIIQFQEALRINPDLEVARDNLRRAQAVLHKK